MPSLKRNVNANKQKQCPMKSYQLTNECYFVKFWTRVSLRTHVSFNEDIYSII